MIVGYRRGAGRIGLTTNESGTRGSWVEKRRTLFDALTVAGHTVIPMSPPTPNTSYEPNMDAQVDILLVEFAGLNLTFFGDDWHETMRIVNNHSGPVVFLCDDPDLPFPWDKMPDEDWSRWTIATNSTQEAETRTILHIPEAARWVDFPMPNHAPGATATYHPGIVPAAVYIGRPNSRTKLIRQYETAPLIVAGKPKEWEGYNFRRTDPPLQSRRQQFYRRYRACLALYDNKHALTGWRTGRAYHALQAGIPVLAPSGNPALTWTHPTHNAQDVYNFITQPTDHRKHIWQQQHQAAAVTVELKTIGL